MWTACCCGSHLTVLLVLSEPIRGSQHIAAQKATAPCLNRFPCCKGEVFLFFAPGWDRPHVICSPSENTNWNLNAFPSTSVITDFRHNTITTIKCSLKHSKEGVIAVSLVSSPNSDIHCCHKPSEQVVCVCYRLWKLFYELLWGTNDKWHLVILKKNTDYLNNNPEATFTIILTRTQHWSGGQHLNYLNHWNLFSWNGSFH